MMISCPCPQIDARIKHQVSCFISNFGGLIALHSQGERILICLKHRSSLIIFVIKLSKNQNNLWIMDEYRSSLIIFVETCSINIKKYECGWYWSYDIASLIASI